MILLGLTHNYYEKAKLREKRCDHFHKYSSWLSADFGPQDNISSRAEIRHEMTLSAQVAALAFSLSAIGIFFSKSPDVSYRQSP